MARQLFHRFGSSLWITFCPVHLFFYCRLSYVKFILHYLDDLHTLGPPNSPVYQNNLDLCIRLFEDRGIFLRPDKLEGPSTRLTVLGIELDSPALQARLLRNKFERIFALSDTCSSKQHCMRKELESLIGNLQHACKVTPQGRTFYGV